ncbi:MAG: acetylglutamate kinase [Defluviitaleaceae bacterium]|nr:acetylglutamate kinase [Defluviitaleaceae bacterium]MCL2263644.1 acetylglutamate kinase [Defluviitaleaceae bacterium]
MKDSLSKLEQAVVISEALPYIQRYHGKTIVIKYGGAAMQSPSLCRQVMGDIVLLSLVGIRVVVVHGGGPEINEMLAKMGKKPRFVNGLRYTDNETMDVVQMVLAGRVGKQMAQLLGELGGKALSLSGMDGRMLTAKKRAGRAANSADTYSNQHILSKPDEVSDTETSTGDDDLGLVGDISGVDPEPINLALSGGYTPVISSIACGEEAGEVYNINADSAAAAVAAAVGAEKLILLTDVRGILRDTSYENTLITTLSLSEVPQLVKEGVISGGMIPKVDCCVEAVRRGVPRAHILDGRIPHSLLVELLSDQGIGTMILN